MISRPYSGLSQRVHYHASRSPFREPVTFSIFSCLLHIQPTVFHPPNKTVILRACDFLSIERPPAPQPLSPFLSLGNGPLPWQRPSPFRHPLLSVIPSEAEGPAVHFTSNQSQLEAPPSPSSS